MKNTTKIGIIICDRYKSCTGGKCFRALKNREGAFNIYPIDETVELVGYTTCGGCPGGNIEYAPEEMIKNGAQIIHLATGFVVGYPPCPNINEFIDLIEIKHGINAVIGTHPIPEKYLINHTKLKTWESENWKDIIKPAMSNKETRMAYN